jgi:hypothetical protein
VPDGVCSEDPAEPYLHTVEPDTLYVQQGTGTPRGGSARESQAAVYFLLTKEIGLVKIRNSFILIMSVSMISSSICVPQSAGMRVRRARTVAGADREYCSCARRQRSEICVTVALFLSSRKYFAIRKCIATC